MEFNATFIVTIISFIVFVILMNAILYRPLEKIVDEREKLIKDNTENAKTLNSEAETLLEKKAREIAQAKADAKNSLDTKLKESYENSSQKIHKAKEESLNCIKEQKQQLQNEKENIKEIMNPDIRHFAQLITDKLLSRNTGEGNE